MKTFSSLPSGAIAIIVIVTLVVMLPLIIFLVAKGAKSQNMKNSYHNLAIGMSKSAVLNMLGKPMSIGKREDGAEVYKWNINEGAIQAVWDKDSTRGVIVVFKDDKVVEFDGHNIDKRIWL